MFWLLAFLALGLGFGLYAYLHNYNSTPADQTVTKRALLAAGAAAASIGAFLMSLIHGWTAP